MLAFFSSWVRLNFGRKETFFNLEIWFNWTPRFKLLKYGKFCWWDENNKYQKLHFKIYNFLLIICKYIWWIIEENILWNCGLKISSMAASLFILMSRSRYRPSINDVTIFANFLTPPSPMSSQFLFWLGFVIRLNLPKGNVNKCCLTFCVHSSTCPEKYL